ncbi:TPA: hypothetical protein O7U53_003231 [Salmonella enterica]|nr:hypothetical protein [Salmonella enterica]
MLKKTSLAALVSALTISTITPAEAENKNTNVQECINCNDSRTAEGRCGEGKCGATSGKSRTAEGICGSK